MQNSSESRRDEILGSRLEVNGKGKDDFVESCRRFVHEDIYISQNGECALFARDADEEEYDDLGSGFAMFLVPKTMLYSPEDCLDFVLGHWSAFTEEDLYSESGHKREGE